MPNVAVNCKTNNAWKSPKHTLFAGLENIPKAELNILFACLSSIVLLLFSSTKIASVLLFLSAIINYCANDKPYQDSLVEKYMKEIGETSGFIGMYDTPRIQNIMRELTHPFFQKNNGPQENKPILGNAVALRMMTTE